MNTRSIIGIVLLILGIIVLIWPQFLAIIVGVALIIAGLYIAMQNTSTGGGNI